MILLPVDPRYPGVWNTSTPYLEQALAEGGYRDWNLQDVLDYALKGFVQLWALIENNEVIGAGITTETSYPKRKVLEILLLGTNKNSMDTWISCLEQLKAFGKARGVSTIQGTGRPGWTRLLKADNTKLVFEINI